MTIYELKQALREIIHNSSFVNRHSFYFFFFFGNVKTLFVTSCIPITRNKSIIFTVSLEMGIAGVDEMVEVFIFIGVCIDITKLMQKANIRKMI